MKPLREDFMALDPSLTATSSSHFVGVMPTAPPILLSNSRKKRAVVLFSISSRRIVPHVFS